jgi:secreted PhoX family phosphatase
MEIVMRPSIRSAQRFFHPAPGASKKVVRGIVGVVGLAGLVGLAGCYGHNRFFIAQQQIVNNALWVANGTNVVEFLPSQLTDGASAPAPHLTLAATVFGAPQGVVFDGFGDLWVIDGGTVASGGMAMPAVYEFTVQQLSNLSKNNAPTPAVTIQSANFKFPQQAAFDGRGDLWVSDSGSNEVYVFLRSQMTASSTTTSSTTVAPEIIMTSSTAFNGPIGIAFDGGGDLFVANNGGNTIYGFKASSLPNLNVMSEVTTPNGPPPTPVTPTVMLSSSSNSIQGPWALAFDGFGNLWSSNAGAASTVVEFTRSQIAATGSPTPNITLASATVSSNATLVSPTGIGFDAFGDLAAVSSAAPFGVAGFGPEQLRTNPTSAPTPDVFLIGSATTLSAPAGVTFGPAFE